MHVRICDQPDTGCVQINLNDVHVSSCLFQLDFLKKVTVLVFDMNTININLKETGLLTKELTEIKRK